MELIVKILPAFGLLALLFVFIKNSWVSKQEIGNDKMERISKNIADGAMSFLKSEYKILSIFVLSVAILLYFKGNNEVGSNGMVAFSFVVGAICSALACSSVIKFPPSHLRGLKPLEGIAIAKSGGYESH